MTVDTGKAFSSVNHSFLLCIFKKIEFGSEPIKWMKILMKNPEYCVVNDGKAKPYFKLETKSGTDSSISLHLSNFNFN